MPEAESEIRKVYSEERRLLIDMEERAAASFDKTVITLSAGALGLSLTFIREIAHTPHSETIWILVAAWLGLGLSLLATLLSFLLSQYGIRKLRELIDRIFQPTEPTQPTQDTQNLEHRINRTGRFIGILNWSSIVFFTVGVIFLAVFTVKNLPTEEDVMADNFNKLATPSDVGKGVVPPKPPVKPNEPTQNPGPGTKK